MYCNLLVANASTFSGNSEMYRNAISCNEVKCIGDINVNVLAPICRKQSLELWILQVEFFCVSSVLFPLQLSTGIVCKCTCSIALLAHSIGRLINLFWTLAAAGPSPILQVHPLPPIKIARLPPRLSPQLLSFNGNSPSFGQICHYLSTLGEKFARNSVQVLWHPFMFGL